MKKRKPTIHPNASKELHRLFRQVHKETGVWNFRETARRLGVNQLHVFDNLTYGKEPTDATPLGRETRLKLGLKEYKPKPKVKREPKPPKLPSYLNDSALPWFIGQREKVSRMSKDMRDEIKKRKKAQT